MAHLPLHGPTGGLALLGGRRAPARMDPAEFERHLLRRSVDVLAADRMVCADCGRTPLVGEDLHLFDTGEVVCELCRPLRRGTPVSSLHVRHSEYGQTVRVSRTT